jgi:tartrate dehydrogenase/decarboxylase/D-malate dehydrogenase
VHGSAPDDVGRGIANPIGAIWGAAMMLEQLGLEREGRSVLEAIAAVCAAGLTTVDIGGSASTSEAGAAIAAYVAAERG